MLVINGINSLVFLDAEKSDVHTSGGGLHKKLRPSADVAS